MVVIQTIFNDAETMAAKVIRTDEDAMDSNALLRSLMIGMLRRTVDKTGITFESAYPYSA